MVMLQRRPLRIPALGPLTMQTQMFCSEPAAAAFARRLAPRLLHQTSRAGSARQLSRGAPWGGRSREATSGLWLAWRWLHPSISVAGALDRVLPLPVRWDCGDTGSPRCYRGGNEVLASPGSPLLGCGLSPVKLAVLIIFL